VVLVFLETSRLLLRQFTLADVDNLFELHSDPDVMRFLNGGKPTPRDEIEAEVLPRLLGDYVCHGGLGVWAAIERSTGGFLGGFALEPAEGTRRHFEVGWRLRKSAWGKGYGTEGARALIHKAFTDLGAQRVFAETMAVNTASRRVMEKSGLVFVRRFHLTWDDPIDGTEHGEVEYALDRAGWEASRTKATVSFRALRRSDLVALSGWLADPEVHRWWPDPNGLEDLESKYGSCIDGTSATEVSVIEVDAEAAGIIQRYRTADYPDWSEVIERAAPSLVGVTSAGIDYLIGRGEFRNRGIGTRAIAAFTKQLFVEWSDVEAVVVTVQQDNRPSWRALERSGYERIWAGSLASDHPSDAGPAYVLLRRR